MKRFKNISLIYECDPPTLERAALLARDNRARLTIIHPIKEIHAASERLIVGQKPVDVRKLVLQEHAATLKEVAKFVRAFGVRPATRLLIGEPFLEIIRDVVPVASTQSDSSQGSLGRVIIDVETSVASERDKAFPFAQGVFGRPPPGMLGINLRDLLFHPGSQLQQDVR